MQITLFDYVGDCITEGLSLWLKRNYTVRFYSKEELAQNIWLDEDMPIELTQVGIEEEVYKGIGESLHPQSIREALGLNNLTKACI